MKFHLNSLGLGFKKSNEIVSFAAVSYFWGQMGAGKTSIARLVDYCLGGDIKLSPAMQNEFVGATLNLRLEQGELVLERARDSDRIVASWGSGEDSYQVIVPARDAAGEVIPGTGIENLSDLLFWRSNVTPPRVRKSRMKWDTGSARLSVRDLLWYCYLDQDDMDSSFFYLEEEAHPQRKQKSRDVLRFVIGFHDERIAELEADLDRLRSERQALSSMIEGLSRALKEVGVESELQISERIRALRVRAESLQVEIENAKRQARAQYATHAADELRIEARNLGDELYRLDEAIVELRRAHDRDTRHLNEIDTLSLKFRRSVSAKAVLEGVAFESCPRCGQILPDRQPGECDLCGQTDLIVATDPTETAIVERDVKSRIAELRDLLERQRGSLELLIRERERVLQRKARIEGERNEASQRYDSAYLSIVLTKERERASLLQEIESLKSLTRLPQMVTVQRKRIAEIEGREHFLRAELKTVRETAESDATNLNRLKSYFLDCLVRSRVPGITSNDRVEIPTTTFFPEVYGPDPANAAVTSFATLSSGGKKTLFKSCFAIALHRLAVQLEAPLPELLLLDSPMKNISERENREHFEDFYAMVYELKASELAKTQLILIDKEFCPPPSDLRAKVESRHMKPDDEGNPPLIPYYRGK